MIAPVAMTWMNARMEATSSGFACPVVGKFQTRFIRRTTITVYPYS